MSANTVSIGAKSKLIAKKGGSSISLEGDCYNNAGIVMENGSDRASNPNFTDDPQNGAAEAKEAEKQANIAALASASQGSQPALGNVSPDLRSPFNLDGRNPFMNGEMNTTLPKNESYITHDDGNSIPVDSIPVYSSANQYQHGQIIRQKGYDGKWYTGTAQEDGTVGTGGYHRYKFVPNNQSSYDNGMSVTNTEVYKTLNDPLVKEIASFIGGFTPADTVVNLASLIEGKDMITGEDCNRGVLAACVFLPEVLDGGLKQAAKHEDDIIDIAKHTDLAEDLAKEVSKAPKELNLESKQIGKKWGKYKTDYLEMKNYNEYKNFSNDIFENPEKIVYDKVNNEYLYIRGNDLLRVKPNGEFISTYPGVSSSRVTNAIKDGGVLWEQP